MGGGSTGSSYVQLANPPENIYMGQLGNLSRSLWNTAENIREPYTNNILLPILQGNYNPETLPTFAPQYDLLRGGMEGQYNQAKQNVMATTPKGGALQSALAQLDYDRARSTGLGTSQLSSNILGDALNKAYQFGFVTGPQTSLAGLGSAAGINQSGINAYQSAALQAQMFNQQMDQMSKQQGKGGLGALGSGIGALAGLVTAPFTGGTSLLGTGLSGISSGMSGLAGKGGGGITSGLGGYSDLMGQANPLSWR